MIFYRTKDLYCDTCKLQYESLDEISNHLEKSHGELKSKEALSCQNCQKIFFFSKLLEIHQKYSCDVCHKFFSTLRYLAAHKRSVHEGKKMVSQSSGYSNSIRYSKCAICDWTGSEVKLHWEQNHRYETFTGIVGQKIKKSLIFWTFKNG